MNRVLLRPEIASVINTGVESEIVPHFEKAGLVFCWCGIRLKWFSVLVARKNRADRMTSSAMQTRTNAASADNQRTFE
jgi:hypothetical protein